MHFYLQFFNSIFLWYTHSTDQEMEILIISDENETLFYSATQKLDSMDAYPFLSVTIIVGIFYYLTGVSFVNLKNC